MTIASKKSVKKTAEKGLTNTAQRTDALARLDALEKQVPALADEVNRVLRNIDEKLDSAGRVLNAVMTIIGSDAVVAKIQEQRIQEIELEVSQVSKALEDAVAANRLQPVTTAESPEDFVVTSQKTKEGTQKYPSRIQTALGGYVPEIAALLTGKSVGDIVTLEDGGTLEVLGVYRAVASVSEPV